VSALAVLGLLASMSTAVSACSTSCDTALTAATGTAHRTGNGAVAAQIQLDLSATLTSGGKGVGGVRIAFMGTLSGGNAVDAAGAVTDADGVAHYSGPADYELAQALTSARMPQTISYVAQTMAVGSTPNSSVCNLLSVRSQPADLHYQP
jgi:hypothetical protein